MVINPFPNKPWFSHVCNRSLLKTLEGKRRNWSQQGISPFAGVFSTLLKNFLPFSSNLNCRLQTLSVWKSLKFVVWEKVNSL